MSTPTRGGRPDLRVVESDDAVGYYTWQVVVDGDRVPLKAYAYATRCAAEEAGRTALGFWSQGRIPVGPSARKSE